MNAQDIVEKLKLKVSPAPHVHGRKQTNKVMFLVIFALMFPAAGGVYFFGLYAGLVMLVSVLTAILTEYIAKALRKQEFIMDGSAIVTGLLFAMVLPPRVPMWMVVIGSAFAIAIVKEAFGGLGHNIFNPALAGRALLAISFAGILAGSWAMPLTAADAVTGANSWVVPDALSGATPLPEYFAELDATGNATYSGSYADLFYGNVAGCIGETSAFLILIGGLILFIPGIIKRVIPIVYIGTVFALTFALGQDPVFHVLAGGLFLGAFFMATDYVTAPVTTKGQIIFAFGAGVLVVMIRIFGSMPEGVAFSILLMNAFTPLIDRYVRPKPYGFVPPEKPAKEEKEEKKPEEKKEEAPKKEEPKQEAKVEEKPVEAPAPEPAPAGGVPMPVKPATIFMQEVSK